MFKWAHHRNDQNCSWSADERWGRRLLWKRYKHSSGQLYRSWLLHSRDRIQSRHNEAINRSGHHIGSISTIFRVWIIFIELHESNYISQSNCLCMNLTILKIWLQDLQSSVNGLKQRIEGIQKFQICSRLSNTRVRWRNVNWFFIAIILICCSPWKTGGWANANELHGFE